MAATDRFEQALRHHQAGELEAAVEAYGASLELTPDDHRALGNLGIALKQLGRVDDAVASCHKAVALRPDYANGWNNLGIALLARGSTGEAIAAYRTAVDLDPRFHESWSNLGIALAAQGSIAEAVSCFEKALAIDPDHTEALVQFLHQSQQMCRWDGLDEPLRRLISQMKRDLGEINPFALLSVCHDPADLLLAGRHYAARVATAAGKAATGLALTHDWPVHRRLRIGYLSADFHQHATAQLTAELFERHDRDRFEVHAYSYGPDDQSPMRRRLIAAFDAFHDVRPEPFAATARRINGDEIDILVDLKGYTQGARTQIMAFRPAPVQVNYLGYPGSMGADFIGYIIVDRFLVPPGEEIHYAEACVFMPGSYQVNDSRRPVAADGGRRAEHGLPEDGVVFCCFNQQAKITPEVFAVWMRVLAQVPGSVLWLVRFNGDAEQPLRAAASSMGVAPDRLVFAPKIATEAHLARYALADLFLDTFPCNAHTTASDALWGGCPVVTCAGKTFAARVAGSLLTALRMEDLITTSLHDYEALALELALDPRRLREIRSRLAEQRSKSGLFDGAKFARTMEQAYGAMWARHTKGVSPEHMDIRLIESESGGSMP